MSMDALSPIGHCSSTYHTESVEANDGQIEATSQTSCSSPGVHIRVDPVPQIDEYEQSECFSTSRNDVNETRAKNFAIVETYYKLELRNLTKFLTQEVVDLSDASRDGKEPFTLHPMVSFCVHQYLLAISELLLRLEKRKVSYRNFREIAENLAGLLEIYHVRAVHDEGCRIASIIMANKMSTLFKQWDVIAMVLEDVFLKQMTDWCELAQVSQRKYPRSLIKHIKPPREIVFSLNHFTKPVLISFNFAGSKYRLYLSQLGHVPIIMRVIYVGKRKIRMPKIQSELRTEAILCVRLRHPLLARPLATAFVDNQFITISELMPSVDLRLLLDSPSFGSRGLPLELTRIILAQIGLVICYLHTSGFIHRDIRAENIYISAFARIKLLCPEQPKFCVGAFSTRRLAGFYRSTAHEFTDHEMPPNHSLHLRPPEIIRGFPYGRSLDWWMVGALGYFLYFHKQPFKRNNEKRTIAAILKGWPKMKKSSAAGFRAFKEFVYKLIHPKPKSRLCSKTYAEFFSHSLFDGFNWNIIEKQNMFIELFEVEDLFELQATLVRRPSISPAVSAFGTTLSTDLPTLSPDMTKVTTMNISGATYTTPVLLRAFEKMATEDSLLGLPWLEDEHEWVDQQLLSMDSPTTKLPYKFNKFFKTTRIPRDTSSSP